MFLKPIFFINDAYKIATLVQFSPVLTSIGLVRSRTQLSLTNGATLLPHHLELTMTTSRPKTGDVGINQGH